MRVTNSEIFQSAELADNESGEVMFMFPVSPLTDVDVGKVVVDDVGGKLDTLFTLQAQRVDSTPEVLLYQSPGQTAALLLLLLLSDSRAESGGGESVLARVADWTVAKLTGN